MTRCLAFLLALLLALPGAYAASVPPVDLSAMDDATLLSLLDSVKAEYLSRLSYSSVLVEKGIYRIGVDVPAGAFRVVHEGNSGITDIEILNDAGRREFFAQVFSEENKEHGSPAIGRLALEPGYILIIQSGEARFFADAGGVTFE